MTRTLDITPAVRLGPPNVEARGVDAIEDARRRVEGSGRRLSVLDPDPSEPGAPSEDWHRLRISIQETGFDWRERRNVRWTEPAEECAYLKVVWVDEAVVEATAPDPISWRFHWGGWLAPDESLESRWKAARLHSRSYNAARTLPSRSQMLRELTRIGEESGEAWQRWKAQVSQPWVEYVNVAPAYRRLGLATALYQAGAGYLATLGLSLRSSTLQQPEAGAVWRRCAELWGLEPQADQVTGEHQVHYLDLRT